MIIHKNSVQQMINQIIAHKDYGTHGHDYDVQQDLELIKKLANFVKNASDYLYISENLESWLEGSILEDIIRGQARPLDYLCSDCRYLKWCLTFDEAAKEYGHVDNGEYVKNNKRKDRFVNISGACPKCGD